MYAIVDIETTGGLPKENGITEIAIVLHDGKTIEGKFHTLVNPLKLIPTYVQQLTGITNAMVSRAPEFSKVAPNIFNLLSERVFVAHNASFDYNFLKFHLQLSGFELDTPTICTVKAARKIFPGYKKYSLGNICESLQIEIANRHRASGDAIATTKLFELLLANDTNQMLKKNII